MKAFQFGGVGNAEERKPSRRGICEKELKKSFIPKREGPHEEVEIQRKACKVSQFGTRDDFRVIKC